MAKSWKSSIWIIVLVGLVLLIVSPFLLAPTYNAWAVRAFERHVAELEAVGETLEIAELKPEPFEHPEKTFARHPMIVRLIEEADQSEKGPDGEELQLLDRLSPKAIPGQLETPDRRTPRYLGIKPLPAFSVATSEEESAQRVLEYYDGFSEEVLALTQSVKLEGEHFELEYEKGYSLLFPEARMLMNVGDLLAVRVKGLLVQGDEVAAAEGLFSLLGCVNLSRNEPSLILQLVALNHHDSAIGLIQEGLAPPVWTEGQLRIFDEMLAEIKTDRRLLLALRMERAIFVDLMKGLARDPEKYLGTSVDTGPVEVLRYLPIMKGWCYDNARFGSEMSQAEIFTGDAGLPSREELPSRTNFEQRIFAIRKRFVPRIRYLFVSTAAPASVPIMQRFHRSRVYRDHARIAIALERHRLETGSLPPNLDPLISVNPDLPVTDPFSGNRYIYKTGSADTYQLYSVGSNRTDEGGLWKKKIDQGDWVWSLVLPEDFDWEDYDRKD